MNKEEEKRRKAWSSSRPCRFPARPPARGERNETKPGPDDDARQGTLTVRCWVLEIADGPPGGERAGRRHDVPCVA